MIKLLRNNKGFSMIEILIVMIIILFMMAGMFAASKTVENKRQLETLNEKILSLQGLNDKTSKDNLVELNKQLVELNGKIKDTEKSNNIALGLVGGFIFIIIIGFGTIIFIDKKKTKKEAEAEYALLHPIIPERVLVGIQDPDEEEYVIINGKKFKKDLIKQKIKVNEKEDVEINTMLVTEA